MIDKNQETRQVELPCEFADCGSCAGRTLSRLMDWLTHEAQQTSAVLSVSLRNVHYCGAGFVGILMKVHRQLRGRNARLELCHASYEIRTLLDICEVGFLISDDDNERTDTHHVGPDPNPRRQQMIRDTESFINGNLLTRTKRRR